MYQDLNLTGGHTNFRIANLIEKKINNAAKKEVEGHLVQAK